MPAPTFMISVRLNATEYAQLEAYATRNQLTVGGAAKHLLLKGCEPWKDAMGVEYPLYTPPKIGTTQKGKKS